MEHGQHATDPRHRDRVTSVLAAQIGDPVARASIASERDAFAVAGRPSGRTAACSDAR
jgi:hypothetical protein